MIKKKSTYVILLCLLLSLTACTAPAKTTMYNMNTDVPQLRGGSLLSAVLLYDSTRTDGSWQDGLKRLESSLILGMDIHAMDISEGGALENADVVYLDPSLAGNDSVAELVQPFVERGGFALVPDSLYSLFDKAFLGAWDIRKLYAYPERMNYPDVTESLSDYQGIIRDYHSLLGSYKTVKDLDESDYGYGLIPNGSTVIAGYGGLALYSINSYGEGKVFCCNAMLPTESFIDGFSMEARNESQTTLSESTLSATMLLESAFAGCKSKEKHGYAANRVFGCFGRPSMNWELHYEEQSGFENDAASIFDALCRESLQIPSYSIIRNAYTWFLRQESVTYLLNQGTNEAMDFSMDMYESAYSSGTHVAVGDSWLGLAKHENAGSYFVDQPQYNYRAYPYMCDLNDDGHVDMIVGSSDGYVYYFQGTGYRKRLHMLEPVRLTDDSGKPISVGSFSAPVLLDLDDDGIDDMLVGAGDSRIYAYYGLGDTTFKSGGVFLETGLTGRQVLPEVADMDGDGALDLLYGSTNGSVYGISGTAEGQLKLSDDPAAVVFHIESGWAAPRAADLNGDGVLDLAIGTFDGYIFKAICNKAYGKPQEGEDTASGLMANISFTDGGYITDGEKDYKGNDRARFGNWAVPSFCDINNDGRTDLVCGCLEYGMAYPIDSEYFAQGDALKAQIRSMLDNYQYVTLHYYTNQYASAERESYELEAHRKALETYGLSLAGKGTNQHTWWTNMENPTQTFTSLVDAGVLWISGYTSSGNRYAPQNATENVLTLPFYFTAADEKKLLLHNTNYILTCGEVYWDMMAAYDIPCTVYYHCDFCYEEDSPAAKDVAEAEKFCNKYDYNFVREDQTMLANAAAINMEASFANTGTTASPMFTVTHSSSSMDDELYDDRYEASTGIKLTFGEGIDPSSVITDADVWYRSDDGLYVGLNKPVSIWVDNVDSESVTRYEPHIERVNIAAAIRTDERGVTISFMDDGMMQVAVFGQAEALDDGWITTTRDGRTIFTKYGSREELHINY